MYLTPSDIVDCSADLAYPTCYRDRCVTYTTHLQIGTNICAQAFIGEKLKYRLHVRAGISVSPKYGNSINNIYIYIYIKIKRK